MFEAVTISPIDAAVAVHIAAKYAFLRSKRALPVMSFDITTSEPDADSLFLHVALDDDGKRVEDRAVRCHEVYQQPVPIVVAVRKRFTRRVPCLAP